MNEYPTSGAPGTGPQQRWQGNPQQGYAPGWPAPAQRTSGQAIAVLVLGVASLTVVWGVAGIAALVLARGAEREITDSQGTLGGAGMIRAGKTCAWISLAFTVLVLALLTDILWGGGRECQIIEGTVSVVG